MANFIKNTKKVWEIIRRVDDDDGKSDDMTLITHSSVLLLMRAQKSCLNLMKKKNQLPDNRLNIKAKVCGGTDKKNFAT